MITESCKDRAAAEMVGALMLISIIVVVFAVIAVFLFSQPPPEKMPVVAMTITNESRLIEISHEGGDVIPLAEMAISVDDQPVLPGAWTCTGCSDDFSIGDIIRIDYTGSDYPNKIDIIFKKNGQNHQLLTTRYLGTMTPTPTPYAPPTTSTPTPTATPTATPTSTPIPTPTFVSIAPSMGSTSGSTSVTITGVNLIGTTAVTFGGAAATGVTVVNVTTITATTPPHTAGTVNVVLTTPNGTATGTDAYTYVDVPAFISITPIGGKLAGGTPVTITGINLIGASAGGIYNVTIGGSLATGVIVVNATTITATTPAHAAGAVNVNITTPNGTATGGTNAYTYAAAPTVTARTNATLNRGWTGYELITGTNFVSGATSVLNTTTGSSIASTTCEFRSSSSLFCSYNLLEAPVSTSYRVAVINPDGQSAIMNPPTSNYVSVTSPRPTLTARTPVSATRNWPAVAVTLTGTNFQPDATVNMTRSGVVINADNVVVVSPTRITCTFNLVGVTASTGWVIRETNTDGQFTASTSMTFGVTNTITVTGITPASGQHGTTVTITNIAGTGFQPGVTQVRFSRDTNIQNQILLTDINVESSTKISGTLVIPPGQTVQTLYVRVTNSDGTTGISSSRIFSVLN